MKTRGALTVVIIVLFLSVVPDAEVSAHHQCTLASLDGAYGFTSTGALVNVGPVANVGIFAFDGEGTFSQDFTNSRNGVITHLSFTGTYTVNPNCTGSWAVPGGPQVDFVIVAGGSEVLFIRTNSGATVTGILRKQSPHDKED